MFIEHLGHSCFAITAKDTKIITDPYSDEIGLKMPRLKADIVTVSHGHYDHNNVGAITGEPFIIAGPGEYERGGVFFWGVPTWHDGKEGAERGPNTAFMMKVEDVYVTHLGDLGHKLDESQIDALSETDILIVPVGGTYTIDANQAVETVKMIEPSVVIPMHYQVKGLKLKIDPVDNFVKELGAEAEQTDKLKIAKKDLQLEGMRVVVFG